MMTPSLFLTRIVALKLGENKIYGHTSSYNLGCEHM
jgi:hypothetical protein